MYIRLKLSFLLLLFSVALHAQRHEIYSDRIASLQVVAGDDWLSPPVIPLNGDVPIHISFDDLTHEHHRYVYKIEHCKSDWTISEGLFSGDFCEGFAEGNTIDDSQESLNTNQFYTHYRFSLPNNKCSLKLSGNYRVTVSDENNNNKPVLSVCFMVVEPRMGVSLEVTSNTDKDINGRHQQLSMEIRYGDMTVTDPTSQIKTVVMQNGRWDNCVMNAKPQYVMGNGLRWEHSRNFIFDGGNEYRKFEMLDVNHTTMGLETIDWDGHMWHAYPWTDEPRKSYIYDEDANGAFYIRNSDNLGNDSESEYLMVHFRLKTPQTGAQIYLNGVWTNQYFTPPFKMKWNALTQQYECALWLKQGYYNYQYLLVQPDGTAVPLPSEGNFFQTENSYQALVYFRGRGDRTDRLVGFRQISTAQR